MTIKRSLAIGALVSLVLALMPPTLSQALTAPIAQGSWSMVPQSKDKNKDGFIDGDGGVPQSGALSLKPSSNFVGAGNYIAQPNERLIGGSLSWYLEDAGFPVTLNACKSKGDTYTWTIQRGGKVVQQTKATKIAKKSCATTVTLPEGLHSFTLTVKSGPRLKRQSMVANISNYLMVVLGDSYSSGEGNPRNVGAWLENRTTSFSPYWDDDQCNRSVRGAPAQAALKLEQASNQTSVTLIDVSCSGATVAKGILGPQFRGMKSQIESVEDLIGNRKIDAVVMSIGGNDVGFGTILTTCALQNNCPLAKATAPPLSNFPTIAAGVQGLTAGLATSYASINKCFTNSRCQGAQNQKLPGLSLSDSGRVFLNSYPDVTRSQTGSICSYLTITKSDFGWAQDSILNPNPTNPFTYQATRGVQVPLDNSAGSLNGAIANTTQLGWRPIMGTWIDSGTGPIGHGVCAGNESWIFGLTGLSGFTSGSFHPNPIGQREIARIIYREMVASGF
jgi:lysophospholipase L1-like esterase